MKELSGQIEMFGLEMKVRFDCINLSPHRTIIDFKTCIDNSPESFKWDSYRYKYWHQAYVYMEASKKLFGNNTISNYFICAIEKEPPFSIAFYKLNPGDIENAGYELLKPNGPVDIWRECLASKKFPDHPEVMYLNLPYKKGE